MHFHLHGLSRRAIVTVPLSTADITLRGGMLLLASLLAVSFRSLLLSSLRGRGARKTVNAPRARLSVSFITSKRIIFLIFILFCIAFFRDNSRQ